MYGACGFIFACRLAPSRLTCKQPDWRAGPSPTTQPCGNLGPARGKIREYPSLTSIHVPTPETLNNIDWITRVPHSLKRHFPPGPKNKRAGHATRCKAPWSHLACPNANPA